MSFATEPRLTLNQVAKQLNVHVATCWRWTLHGVRGRRLKTVRIGGRRWVMERDLNAFLEADLHSDGPCKSNRRQRDQIADAILNAHGLHAR